MIETIVRKMGPYEPMALITLIHAIFLYEKQYKTDVKDCSIINIIQQIIKAWM